MALPQALGEPYPPEAEGGPLSEPHALLEALPAGDAVALPAAVPHPLPEPPSPELGVAQCKEEGLREGVAVPPPPPALAEAPLEAVGVAEPPVGVALPEREGSGEKEKEVVGVPVLGCDGEAAPEPVALPLGESERVAVEERVPAAPPAEVNDTLPHTEALGDAHAEGEGEAEAASVGEPAPLRVRDGVTLGEALPLTGEGVSEAAPEGVPPPVPLAASVPMAVAVPLAPPEALAVAVARKGVAAHGVSPRGRSRTWHSPARA